MSGVLLGAAAAVLVAGTGFAVAATLRLPDLPRLLLSAYVVGFAEVAALILLLSPFNALSRVGILISVSLVFGASIALWFFVGAPRPPRVALGRARDLKRTPLVLVLGVVTGLALLYVFALIVGTPPTNHDSLTYHLTRVAFWMQVGGVHYIPDAYDARMNAHPPNAELALTFLLELSRNERLAGLVQFVAVLAVAVGVYALARHLRLSFQEAVFGALLFLTLPIVLLEASTAQNDLVAASLSIAATLFLLGDSRRELALAALATALAVGTKVPAAVRRGASRRSCVPGPSQDAPPGSIPRRRNRRRSGLVLVRRQPGADREPAGRDRGEGEARRPPRADRQLPRRVRAPHRCVRPLGSNRRRHPRSTRLPQRW